MGMPVLIFGKSGAGKSRSLKNFDKDELFLIKCIDKPLPFRGKFTKDWLSSTGSVDNIIKNMKNAVEKGGYKRIAIDDAGYIMTKVFMAGHTSGDNFKLYNGIADQMYSLVNSVKELPEDVIVYIIMHEEVDEYGNLKLRTIGKLLDQKVCIEGMVTICLRCALKDGKHIFITNSVNGDITKSPEEMFDDLIIENDLKFVDEKIREYYELAK